MRSETIAKILLPLALTLFAVVFVRFCVSAFQAREWTMLIGGGVSTLAVLTLFVGFWVTIKRGKPIAEHEVRLALAVFLVIASTLLNIVTP